MEARGCTISVSYQQILLEHNALLKWHIWGEIFHREAHVRCLHLWVLPVTWYSFPVNQIDLWLHWQMRNLVSIAADGIYCQNPSLARDYVFIGWLMGLEQAGLLEHMILLHYYINFALICIFNSSMSWLHYIAVKQFNLNMMDLHFLNSIQKQTD